MPKILKLIHKCKDCPHWHYYSGGAYECREAERLPIHPDKGNEAPPTWCPLPNSRMRLSICTTPSKESHYGVCQPD